MNGRIDELEQRVALLERLLTDLVCHGLAAARHPGQRGARRALRDSCRRAAGYWKHRQAERLIALRRGAIPEEPTALPDWVARRIEEAPCAEAAQRAETPAPALPPPQVRLPYRDD